MWVHAPRYPAPSHPHGMVPLHTTTTGGNGCFPKLLLTLCVRVFCWGLLLQRSTPTGLWKLVLEQVGNSAVYFFTTVFSLHKEKLCAVRGLFTHVVDSNLHCEVGGDSQSVPTPSFVSSFQSFFWKRLPRESKFQFGQQTTKSGGFHPVFLPHEELWQTYTVCSVRRFNSEALNSWIFIAVFKKAFLSLSGNATEPTCENEHYSTILYIQLFGVVILLIIVQCCLYDDVFMLFVW